MAATCRRAECRQRLLSQAVKWNSRPQADERTAQWVCPKADQYTFSPGMGVRFTEINPDIRNRVLEVVKSLQTIGQPA